MSSSFEIFGDRRTVAEFRPSLRDIGLRHGSDKFTVHNYDSVYEIYLEPWRDRPVRLLEIGIGGESRETAGASLLTWRDYLPASTIVGIDIFDKSALDSEGVTTVLCDQADPVALKALCARHGPFDVIIDDGNHMGPDVALSFFTLFPELNPAGIYFIEDVQTSYWPYYRGSSLASGCYDTAARWAKLAIDIINRGEVLDPSIFPVAAGLEIAELHVHHNIIAFRRQPIGISAVSKILRPEDREAYLSADWIMHGDIADLHQQLLIDPRRYRSLLQAVHRYGGLEKLLADCSLER